MGWFSSLFKKEKGMETVCVELDQLPAWFDEKTEPFIDNIKDDVQAKLNEIKSNCESAKENLRILEQARLMNDKLPERALSIMKGNRDSYINQVNIFINQIKIPNAINIGSITEFLSKFEDDLNNFTRISARNFYILQEFFKAESGAIAQNLKNINMITRSLLDNDYKQINKVREKIEQVNDFLVAKKKAMEIIGDEDTSLKSAMASKKEIEDKIEKLEQSRDFKDLKSIEEERKAIKSEIKKNDDEIHMLFSGIDKALKKYSKIAVENEKLIDEYIQSAAHAMMKDKELKIISILAKISGLVETDQLELKDRKKDKIIESISNITTDKLKQFVRKSAELNDSLEKLKKRESINMASQKLNELNYKLSHINDQIRRSESYIDKTRKQIDKADLTKRIADIEKDVESLLSVRLKVMTKDEAAQEPV